MALACKPNPAHYALAELARRKEGFVTLSQNVDGKPNPVEAMNEGIANRITGLSERVGHPPSQLHLLHGSLFDIRCTSFFCNYYEQNNFTDPIVPALAIPKGISQPGPLGTPDCGDAFTNPLEDSTKSAFSKQDAPEELDISDDRVELAELGMEDLPKCPGCQDGILRPGVVWFGEPLPAETLRKADAFLAEPKKIDLILVIGTSSKVYPAAGYVEEARQRGARVAVINMDRADIPGGRFGLNEGDWFFGGDASIVLPELLKSEIGDTSDKVEER